MRLRPDLVLASVIACLCFVLTQHAVQADPEPGKVCCGDFNCANGPCVGPTTTGNSCATVKPINHGLCKVADAFKNCTTELNMPCAELQDYGGEPCEGGPCQGAKIGDPYQITQPGCALPDGPADPACDVP